MEEGYQRANIIYFLSHDSTFEHPRLVTVHHLCNSSIHLHDVKRWLADLRGKDMPDSFIWSYKRKYKSGYMWQVLKDDDLIIPISDNEYILRGSFVRSHSFDEAFDNTDKKAETIKEKAKDHQVFSEPRLEPETLQRIVVFKSNASARKHKVEQSNVRCHSKASHIFCNMLNCGTTDANDSVLLPTSQGCGGGPCNGRPTDNLPRQQQRKSSDAENFRKNQTSGGGKSTKRKRSNEYKPVGAPNCSQCGKPFDPKKLHTHMQSCKALRGQGKGKKSLDSPQLRRESQSKEESFRESKSISG